jgi:hypothetical protein
MSKQVAFAALLALMVLTLALTLVAVWFRLDARSDLLELSRLLFSWQVVGGGMTIAGVSMFANEIRGMLQRVAVPMPPPSP